MAHKERNISRIDIDEPNGRVGTHGYEVRVMRRGESHCRFFGDTAFGGKRKALAAARVWRDEIVSAHAGFSRKEIAEQVTVRNTSGIVGVRRSVETDKRWPEELVYVYWVAQWSPAPGVRKTRRFSVEKYGEEQAMQMAIKARQEGMKAVEE